MKGGYSPMLKFVSRLTATQTNGRFGGFVAVSSDKIGATGHK